MAAPVAGEPLPWARRPLFKPPPQPELPTAEGVVLLPPLPTVGSTSFGTKDYAAGLRAAEAFVTARSGNTEKGRETHDGCPRTETAPPLTLTDFGGGGAAHWNAWLARLASLDNDSVTACGPALWEYVASLAKALSPGQLIGDLGMAAAQPALRLASGVAPLGDATFDSLATVIVTALAALGDRFREETPVLTLAACMAGLAALLRVFNRVPAARTPIAVRAADTWLRVTLLVTRENGGVESVAREFLLLLDAAGASQDMACLNLGWRLLKMLCLDASCGAFLVHGILGRSAAAAGICLAAQATERNGHGPTEAVAAAAKAASAGQGAPEDAIATFHCSNFVRIVRDAPSLSAGQENFPLRAMASALAPAATALWLGEKHSPASSSTLRRRDMLSKVISLALERWLAGGIRTENLQDAMVEQLEPLLELSASVAAPVLATNALLLLADASRGGGRTGPLGQALLGVALGVLEKGTLSSSWRPAACDIEALASLCAAGAPRVRLRLWSWATSPEPVLYCLALRVHGALPKWMGVARAVGWAQQILADGLGAIEDGSLGRGLCQVASCVAVLIGRCPPDVVVSDWVLSALAPILRDIRGPHGGGGGSGCGLVAPQSAEGAQALAAFAWPLVRRLGAVAARSNIQTIGTTVRSAAGALASALRSSSGKVGTDATSRAADLEEELSSELPHKRKLRAVAALTRSGLLEEPQLEKARAHLQSILACAAVPLATRAEAWAAHAEACLCGAESVCEEPFRILLRYAVKHLCSLQSAGVRVADALARAPWRFLAGDAHKILEGLSSVEWPLRTAGLAAAAAWTAAPDSKVTAPLEAATTARSTVIAFAEERAHDAMRATAARAAGSSFHGVLSWPDARRAKRRRLLKELIDAELVGDDNDDEDQELHELCVAAASRVDAWRSPRTGVVTAS
eukprot:TRINITY_DN35530_c0_g3_i1.p1 TRINITY_DN35530_c0_g3~~TRINITY_DN35530_c0_g3_i1.p1  ORF type:complete len:923 (-),score=141.24 TRINITY_DN35530_c0_g3_i1:247-3015(-)